MSFEFPQSRSNAREVQRLRADNDLQEANRRSMPSRLAALAFLGVLVSVPGCGGAGPKGPHGTVHGKLTINGAAVPSGTLVTFISDAGGTASGLAGTDGGYRLTSMSGENVPVGKYKVVVMPASVESSLTPEQQMEESMKAMESGKAPAPAAKSVIPAKYGNLTTTPEAREVKEGDNEINVELTD
jgi:hypothetical protein